MPYEISDAQRRFLSRKYAEDRELDRACNCRGCPTDGCSPKGFVRGCHCEDNMEELRKARGL